MAPASSSSHPDLNSTPGPTDDQNGEMSIDSPSHDQSQSESSWRRLLFPFSSPAPAPPSEPQESATSTEEGNNTTTPSASISNSLTATPQRDNSMSHERKSRRDRQAADDVVYWDSTPALDGGSISMSASFAGGDPLAAPLLQFTPSQLIDEEEDDHDDFLRPPPTTLRRQRSSWSRQSRNRRPALNGLNLLNAVAFCLYATVFVWTTVLYWHRLYSDDNHYSPNNMRHHHVPLLTPASWYFWYATKFPLIVLLAAFATAQLLPVYRNRSMVQSGRDGGGVGYAFAQVCVLQLVSTLCWSVTMALQMQMTKVTTTDANRMTADYYFYNVDELVIQDDDNQQQAPVPLQHYWGWRALMLLQTVVMSMSLLVLASLWMRRSSLSIASGGSSACSVVRRIVDYIVLELPFSWLLGSVCVELVHLLAVLVLQWESPWNPHEYGAWPRAMDYMGLAWLLPVALFCLMGWRPGAGSHGEHQDDHIMNALLLQQSSVSAAPTPAWRPDFCLPAVILVAYVSIAMRLQHLQRLALDREEDAEAAIHFYGGTDVVESLVIVSFVLTGTVGVVWILVLVVWLSRQFCTIRVVQVALEDEF